MLNRLSRKLDEKWQKSWRKKNISTWKAGSARVNRFVPCWFIWQKGNKAMLLTLRSQNLRTEVRDQPPLPPPPLHNNRQKDEVVHWKGFSAPKKLSYLKIPKIQSDFPLGKGPDKCNWQEVNSAYSKNMLSSCIRFLYSIFFPYIISENIHNFIKL